MGGGAAVGHGGDSSAAGSLYGSLAWGAFWLESATSTEVPAAPAAPLTAPPAPPEPPAATKIGGGLPRVRFSGAMLGSGAEGAIASLAFAASGGLRGAGDGSLH